MQKLVAAAAVAGVDDDECVGGNGEISRLSLLSDRKAKIGQISTNPHS